VIFKFSFYLIFFTLACTKDLSQIYSKDQMLSMTIKADPTARLILPKDMESGVKCKNYGEGCKGGYRSSILELEMTYVEFESPEQAKVAAQKIDQYYSRNWVFDDVKGEPDLERFVKKVYKAKLARED
jgi:hypothetical protein